MSFNKINGFTRLFYLVSLLVVYLIKMPILYFYIIFFFINVEILLSKKSKSNTKVFKVSQIIFTLFVSYVLFVRAHMCGFSIETENNLNTVEHLLFSLVTCLMIYYYISFFGNKANAVSILISALVFNAIGLINEFFQNYVQDKPIFLLDQFAIKDLIVNGLGAILFIILITLFKFQFRNSVNHN